MFLKHLRQEEGLTRSALAEVFQVKRENIWSFESGRHNPTSVSLKRYAERYEIDLGLLMAVVRGKITLIDGITVEPLEKAKPLKQSFRVVRPYILKRCTWLECDQDFLTDDLRRLYCSRTCSLLARQERRRVMKHR